KEYVANRQHAGKHGMILVVIAMQAVSTDGLEVLEPIYKIFDRLQILTIFGIVDGIRLGNAKHTAIQYITGPGQPDAFKLLLRKLDEVRVRHGPEVVPFGAKVLQPQAGRRRIRDHIRAPVLEVLDT